MKKEIRYRPTSRPLIESAKADSMQRVVSCEQARAAIEAEPELPGEMPDEIWQAMSKDKDAAAECLRIVVRQTKAGIIQRLNL